MDAEAELEDLEDLKLDPPPLAMLPLTSLWLLAKPLAEVCHTWTE